MTKIAIQSDKITPFGGISSIMQQFDRSLSQVIDSTLGVKCKFYGYQYSEILRSLMCIYFCGGSSTAYCLKPHRGVRGNCAHLRRFEAQFPPSA